MKSLFIIAALAFALAVPAHARPIAFMSDAPSSIVQVKGGGKSSGGSHSVRGYTRKDGTYVAPHRRSNPDSSKTNNWSSKGNTNPYTGEKGKVDPFAVPSTR